MSSRGFLLRAQSLTARTDRATAPNPAGDQWSKFPMSLLRPPHHSKKFLSTHRHRVSDMMPGSVVAASLPPPLLDLKILLWGQARFSFLLLRTVTVTKSPPCTARCLVGCAVSGKQPLPFASRCCFPCSNSFGQNIGYLRVSQPLKLPLLGPIRRESSSSSSRETRREGERHLH